MIGAKYPVQQDLAAEFGADVVSSPDELGRAVRRATGSFMVGPRLSGGADVGDRRGRLGRDDHRGDRPVQAERPRGAAGECQGVVDVDPRTGVASRDRTRRLLHLRQRAASGRAPRNQFRAGH